MPISRPFAVSLYRSMVLVREFEQKVQEVYRSAGLPGGLHLYVGEEAVAAGVCSHLNNSDYVTSTHRGHGHALVKGVAPRALFAEIWGKATGCCGGRGGSMHIYEPACGFLGTNGVVGAGIPIGAGAALAARLEGAGRIAVAFFGDGAVNNCAFHEGVNLAAAWQLPVVLVCENNLYATEMSFERATHNTDVASRGAAYGIPGLSVDGNDVLAVHEAAGAAIDRARTGGGPTLLECRTYRPGRHSEGDAGTNYRTAEEVRAWLERCPIRRFRSRMLAEATLAGDDLLAIDREIAAIVEDAVEFARSSPEPPREGVLDHVFA